MGGKQICQKHYGNMCLGKAYPNHLNHYGNKRLGKSMSIPLWEQLFGETCPNHYGKMCFETIMGTGVQGNMPKPGARYSGKYVTSAQRTNSCAFAKQTKNQQEKVNMSKTKKIPSPCCMGVVLALTAGTRKKRFRQLKTNSANAKLNWYLRISRHPRS